MESTGAQAGTAGPLKEPDLKDRLTRLYMKHTYKVQGHKLEPLVFERTQT